MQEGEPPESNMEKPLLATCTCSAEARTLVVRTLKNKWPKCSCGLFMKVEKQWLKTTDK